MVVKSIFQVFEDAACEFVLPAVDSLLADKSDRHKQRAAGELIGGAPSILSLRLLDRKADDLLLSVPLAPRATGMVRGSKHWSLKKQGALWAWLTPKLPSIFAGVTPETQTVWEMCAEYILSARDPRRNQPLVDYLTSLKIDEESAEAFNVSKQQDREWAAPCVRVPASSHRTDSSSRAHAVVGTAMKSLGWHFSPWASQYLEMYSANIAHPYQEVRGAVADNLRVLSELRLHPSYGSVEEFIRDSQHPHARRSLVSVDATYEARIDDFGRQLAQWRAERKPASEGTSQYDKASMTILTWIWGSISEVRTSSAFPFITKLLPEFFRMQESTDNQVRLPLPLCASRPPACRMAC